MLKEFFLSMIKRKTTPTELDIEDIAKKTLFPSKEVKMWLEHLEQVDFNRRGGAAKASENRRKWAANATKSHHNPDPIQTPESQPNVDPEYYCSYCGGKYEEETDEEEF